MKFHNDFHALFGNRTPEEQIRHLRKMCGRNGIIIDNVIYNTFRLCFDEIFGGRRNFAEMVKVLRQWDLPEETKLRCANKLASLKRVLNNKIVGGVSLRRFK